MTDRIAAALANIEFIRGLIFDLEYERDQLKAELEEAREIDSVQASMLGPLRDERDSLQALVTKYREALEKIRHPIEGRCSLAIATLALNEKDQP